MGIGCGQRECCVSTGIHEGFTFGSGRLDFYGYWEIPCHICAREHERRFPEDGRCWPFQDQVENHAKEHHEPDAGRN